MPDIATTDVQYGLVDGVPLAARLYRPASSAPFAAVVSVRGGAWTRGDLSSGAAIDAALAAAGILVMAADFRMPPLAHYPASIADINLAVRWLKRHGPDWGVPAHRVGGLGTSSGGHQIALNALRPLHPPYRAHALPEAPDLVADLAFLVTGWAVLDPLARYDMAVAGGRDELLAAHHAYWPDRAAMAEGNPQRILERGEAGLLPPALLLQGLADTNLPVDMAERFAHAYRRSGGTVTVETFPGEGHAFVNNAPESESARRALAAMIRFIRDAAA